MPPGFMFINSPLYSQLAFIFLYGYQNKHRYIPRRNQFIGVFNRDRVYLVYLLRGKISIYKCKSR
jgi:hypothetical protein